MYASDAYTFANKNPIKITRTRERMKSIRARQALNYKARRRARPSDLRSIYTTTKKNVGTIALFLSPQAKLYIIM